MRMPAGSRLSAFWTSSSGRSLAGRSSWRSPSGAAAAPLCELRSLHSACAAGSKSVSVPTSQSSSAWNRPSVRLPRGCWTWSKTRRLPACCCSRCRDPLRPSACEETGASRPSIWRSNSTTRNSSRTATAKGSSTRCGSGETHAAAACSFGGRRRHGRSCYRSYARASPSCALSGTTSSPTLVAKADRCRLCTPSRASGISLPSSGWSTSFPSRSLPY
mmetsp:Transcript_20731/g.61232  ORF Transcript_20731/g.61232 Transcript_20731/m.61232 type:complete len:218 (+) Transcript_20731:134-787(+)